MAKHVLPTLLLLSLGLTLACADQKPAAATKADPAAVAKWVAQLGSDRFDEREAAFAALEALGPAVLDGLRKAIASPDEETRRRAIDLVLRIEKRLESAQLTQPKMVHLVYKDTPVTQAVQDIAQKTGFQIQLEGDQNKFAKRKITLDTGELPFWQAVDQFCQQAGLVERGSDPLTEMPVNPGYAMNNAVFLSDISYGGPRGELALVLVDGKPQILPTHYAGAMRVRVLPRAVPNGAPGQDGTPVNKANEETLFTFQISPEPKMGLQTILNVRVDRVVDDQGNELKTPLPYICEPFEAGAELWRAGLGNTISFDASGQQFSKRVPIRLHVPDGVKTLKEVRGSVAAEVLTPPQPLITMEDILNAADKKIVGIDGGSMKVLEVKRDDKGQVVMRVVIEKAPTPEAAFPGGMGGMVVRPGGGIARVAGGGFGGEPQPQGAASNAIAEFLSLVDDKNQAFKLIAAEDRAIDGQTNEYRLTFQPPSGAPKPAKLVYSGRRHTTIDVPFVLRDVPVRGDKNEPRQLDPQPPQGAPSR
jgi:hypothetical protein